MKKKIILMVVLVILLIGLAVLAIINCPKSEIEENKLENEINHLQNNETNKISNVEMNNNTNDNINNAIQNENTRVKLTINNEEMYIILDYNRASRDFIKMLPLTVECEDYNNTEKIADLPNTLSTEDSPDGYTPKIGDFAYYAPWGNLSIFYQDFRYSNSLIKLGTFESGIEKIAALNGDFMATFELANN